MKKISIFAWAAMAWACLGFSAQAQDLVPPMEYSKFIKSAEMVGPLKDDLFGEQVGMYNGQTEFVVTDASLKGNSSLPVALGRRFVVEQRTSPTSYGGFGVWDVEVPYLSGTFANAPYKWDQGVYGITNRCSAFFMADAGPTVSVTDVHKGVQMYIPGQGSQELINFKDSGNPMPSDGYPYIWGTRDGVRFQCKATTGNGYPGEGFIAIMPDGTRYTFDIGLEKIDVSMKVSQLVSIGRRKIYLLASRVEDRFGNWVSYQYSSGKVTSISSNDGRSITFSYSGDNISSASVNGRVWTYQYNPSGAEQLQKVTAPDGSAYTYQYLVDGAVSTRLKPRYVPSDATASGCPEQDYNPTNFTLVTTHPSGAAGTFVFDYNRQHKTGTPVKACGLAANGNSYRLGTPDYYDLYSLTKKTITGPGLGTLTWAYHYTDLGYGRTNAPTPCTSCISSKWNYVTNPDGTQALEQYGTLYRLNDGRLLAKRIVSADGQTIRSEAYTYLTDAEAVGQPFPGTYGLYLYNAEPSSANIRPIKATTITQDGTVYTKAINSFDAFVRPVSVSRYSPWNSRTDTTEYFDDLAKWVINQPAKVTNNDTGVEISQASYNANDQPTQIWSYGLNRPGISGGSNS